MRTILIETPNLSDAAIMVEACHAELMRSGLTKEADMIRGLEVFSLSDASTALGTLQQINVCEEGASNAIRYAKAVLAALMQSESNLSAVG
jgi:hypothetical protein